MSEPTRSDVEELLRLAERARELRRTFRNQRHSQGERTRSWAAFCHLVDNNWQDIHNVCRDWLRLMDENEQLKRDQGKD